MSSAKSLEVMPSDCLRKLTEEAAELAAKLREEGAKVSTAEVVTAVQLAIAYTLATGQLVCSFKGEPGVSIARVAMVKNPQEEKLFDEVMRSRSAGHSVREGVLKDLKVLGLDFGRAVNTRAILNRGDSRLRDAYARLKLLGLIRRGKHGEYVVERKRASKILAKLESTYKDYVSAVRSAALHDIMRSGYTAALLSGLAKEDLERLPLDRIIDVAVKASTFGNIKLAQTLIEEASERLERGARIRDAQKGYELLRSFGRLSPEALASLLASEPRLIERVLDEVPQNYLKIVLKSLKGDALERVVQILSRSKRGLKLLEELMEELDSKSLSSVAYAAKLAKASRASSVSPVYLLAALAHVERLLLAAFEQGSEATYEYAMYELDRILNVLKELGVDIEQEEPLKRELERLRELAKLASGEVPSLFKLLKLYESPYVLLETLHRLSSSPNDDIRRKARTLARRLLSLYMYSLKRQNRGVAIRKYSTLARRRRLELRRTVRRLLTFNSTFLVFVDRKMKSNVVVVVDKSGSMRPYALTAALTGLAFAGVLRRLVLFDSKAYIYDAPRRGCLNKVIDLVLSTSFEGYTNLSEALLYAVRGLKPGTLIVVTDLKQTVSTHISVEEAFRKLRRAGWKILLLTPPSYDDATLSKVSHYVLKTYVVKDEKTLEKILRAILRTA